MNFLEVRPILKQEAARYQELMGKLHYLGASATHLTKALQYVVIHRKTDEWLALMDWGYASLKNSERDAWIGWDSEQKLERLKHVVTNTRFLLLPEARRYRFLASQVLSQVTNRLSADWSRYHGNHVLLAETYVDPQRFSGTCYRAANWLEIGKTKGFSRSNNKYVEHGNKKLIFLFPLHRQARQILRSKGFPHRLIMADPQLVSVPINLNALPLEGNGGLLDALRNVPDGRGGQGQRYNLISILALTVCAVLSGIDSMRGIAEFSNQLPKPLRLRFGLRHGIVPDEETLRRTINKINTTQFDTVVRGWVTKNGATLKNRVLAIDGKTMRAANTHILSAVLHHDGVCVAAVPVDDKTNEIPVAQRLLKELPLKNTIVTLDALHTQKETARIIVREKGSDYLMTVKENQRELLEKLQSLPEEAFSPSAHNTRQGSRKS